MALTSELFGNEFKSREGIFMEALEVLKPDHKSHMVALYGMGGVGKTVMMQQIQMVVTEKKMFHYIVRVVIGEKVDIIAIQEAVAEYLGIQLAERSIVARAYKLWKTFEACSNGGKNKILLILDDIWQFLDLHDIGLSPLPNQGVDFKVLLTSRYRDVCIMMGVEVNSILHVGVLQDSEAQMLFRKYSDISEDADPELCQIGDDIVNKCHGLPLAIKMIACSLRGRSMISWKYACYRSMHHDIDIIDHIFKMSYDHLQDEEARSTLLLCGLFPEGFDTPREDLVRCGWGLNIFAYVHTIREARNRLNNCIEQLMNSSLLIESRVIGCVKIHNLVRSFVLGLYSEDKHASFIGDMSYGLVKGTSELCKRISLTCENMSEFPQDYKYPNLLLLKLMHGDKTLKFPENFCGEMKNLQVIAYDRMQCPLPARSFLCSNNLRTLTLHRCLLNFDCSPIGDLKNLEVLSFAHCNIQKLPSTIGNLKELKLLDLTGCINLLIDDGVLNNLVKLEELYMRVAGEETIKFTNSNYNDLVERSKDLSALEIEFLDNNALLKNMSFKNLERFKISLGCYLREDSDQNKHSFENTLMLFTNKCELLDSMMHELFAKTEVLNLQVGGIIDLKEILVDSLYHHQTTFYNLRVLDVCECANLRYLFTVYVANGLTKLERLTISFCPVLETLVDSRNGEVGAIKFQALKFLSMGQMPKLMSLCNSANVIELPQLEELILYNLPNFTCIFPAYKPLASSMWSHTYAMQSFLNREVIIPKLKILKIFYMTKLKAIWPSQFSNHQAASSPILRQIIVEGCNHLVNLFPSNSMSLLHDLEELKVWNCGSIDVLFNIDLGCIGQVKEGDKLRHIEAIGLVKLRDIWRVKGVNNSNILIPRVEYIEIRRCESFRNVINYDMRALMKVTIDGIDGWEENESLNEMVESNEAEEEEEAEIKLQEEAAVEEEEEEERQAIVEEKRKVEEEEEEDEEEEEERKVKAEEKGKAEAEKKKKKKKVWWPWRRGLQFVKD